MLRVWSKKKMHTRGVIGQNYFQIYVLQDYFFQVLHCAEHLLGPLAPNWKRSCIKVIISYPMTWVHFFFRWDSIKLTLLAVESFLRLWYPGELGEEWSERSGRMGTESLPPQSKPPRSEAEVPPLGMVGPMVSMLVKLLLRPWKMSTQY